MVSFDTALEYLHFLGRGGKYSALKYDDIFRGLQSCALRKGFSNEILTELVKLWFKIKIPLTKWSSLGYILIPEGKVSDDLVHTAMQWILGNYLIEKNYFKVVAALNWLIGLLDYNLIDPEALDIYYEFFFSFLYNDKYLIPCTKLIYDLTKSQDVNRFKVNTIIKLMDKRRSSRHYNCLVVVLSLFKSYRPECVPEEVPNISVNTALPKTNKIFAERFQQAQIRSNIHLNVTSDNRLVWWTAEGRSNHFTRNKQTHLVPDLEYMQLGALIYTPSGKQKKCFDFASTRDVLMFHYGQPVEIPANILSLVVNDAGLHILQFSDAESQARFSYVLYHTLHSNFINSNPRLSYKEMRHFLRQIAKLQGRLMQGIPVVSRFLSQYISTWNGTDFLDEILELLEWTVFKSYDELYDCVLEHLECLYLTNDSIYCYCLLNTLGKMYMNIHDILTTKRKLLFLSRSDDLNADDILSNLASFIDDLCNKTLSTFPDDMILKHSLLSLYEIFTQVQLTSELPLWDIVPPSLVYNILCSFNGFSINRLSGLLLKYRSIYEKVKFTHGKGPIRTQIALVEKYTADFINCLWNSRSISWRNDGLMLKDLPKGVHKYLDRNTSGFDKYLDFTNHFAFKMIYQGDIYSTDRNLDKGRVFKKTISPYFHNIDRFVNTVLEQKIDD